MDRRKKDDIDPGKQSDSNQESSSAGAGPDTTRSKKNWSAYNRAAVTEKDQFQRLLYELCHGLEASLKKSDRGRPNLNLADMLFASVFKVYTMLPTRRFMSDLRDAHSKGYISRVPHFNSISDFMREKHVPGHLHQMIVETGRVFRDVETVFAVDSTGFGVPLLAKRYNPQKRRLEKIHSWRKLHTMCGVKTKIITAAEVSHPHAGDSRFFPRLVEKTGLLFKIDEVSADAGYISAENQRIVLLHGGMPLIAYRSNCTPYGNFKSSFWKKTLKLFLGRDPEFMARYYKRNNIETAFSMIKQRHRARLLNKSKEGQVSEALCLALSHNLCVINLAIHELGIAPAFWASVPPLETPSVREMLKANLPERLSSSFGGHMSNSDGTAGDSAEGSAGPLQLQLFGEEITGRAIRCPPLQTLPQPKTRRGNSSAGSKRPRSRRHPTPD